MKPSHRVFFSGTRQVSPLPDRLETMAAAGFTATTVWPGDLKGVDPAALRARLEDLGMVVTDAECIGNWLPGHDTGTGMFADMVRNSTPERFLQLASKVNARTVSIVEIMEQPWEPASMAAALQKICDDAALLELRIAIEFVPYGAINTLGRALDLIDRAERPNLGIMVDSWHFFRSESSLDQLARVPGDLIHSVQLSDAPAQAEPDFARGMMERLMPGDGGLDLKALMQALSATGTTAPAGIEVFSPRLDALPTDEVIRRCAEALDHCLSLAG